VSLTSEIQRRGAETVAEVREILSWPQRCARWFIAEVRWLFRVIVSSADRFYWGNSFSKAASLAYTTLLSLVPITALAFGLLASFAVSGDKLPEIRRFIFSQFVPNTVGVDSVLHYLGEFSGIMSSLNILVAGFLVVTAILLINSIEYALNEVWQVYESRTIGSRIGIYSAVIVVAPVLALSAYYFGKFRLGDALADEGLLAVLNTVYISVLPFLIDFVAFFFLYYLVPKAPVQVRSAIFGAFLGALLFGLAKTGFTVYVERFSSYYTIYQTLAAIPIFLFWLYLAWTIVLFGAEASYQAQYLPRNGKLWKRSVLSVGDAGIVLATQALVMIADAFLGGRKLPNDIEIAERLGCSTVVLKPALDALERAGILARGDSRDTPLILVKSPESITLEAVRHALFSARQALHFPGEMARMFSSFDQPGDKAVTLADLVKRPGPGDGHQKGSSL
jgi:membrane protein